MRKVFGPMFLRSRLFGEQSFPAHHGGRSTWPEERDCALLDRAGLPITTFSFQEGLVCLISGLTIHLTKGWRHRIEKSNGLLEITFCPPAVTLFRKCACECEQEPDAGIRIAGRLVDDVPRTFEGRQGLRDVAALFVNKSEVCEFGDNVR